MPTYEYACDSCGNGFEVIQKMSDAPVKTCPSCGKGVRRVLSGGIGISFKGSGFYVNDSGGKPAAASKSASGASSTAAAVSTAATKSAQPAGASSSGD